MKKGYTVAMAGLLIFLAVLGYSYKDNKTMAPESPKKETAQSTTAPVDDKETIGTPNNKQRAVDSTKSEKKTGNSPAVSKSQSTVNNPASTPESKPVTGSVTAAESKPPRNAAEAIEQGKKNKESMWLLFRSTTCTPCIEMQEIFDEIQPDYQGKVHFIAIDVNDSNNLEVLKAWQIRYIPTTYIINSEGKISYQNIGVIPLEDLKKELDKVVK